VTANSLASTDGAQLHSKDGRCRKPQIPAGLRLQASASLQGKTRSALCP
jgi:hypothetical protein